MIFKICTLVSSHSPTIAEYTNAPDTSSTQFWSLYSFLGFFLKHQGWIAGEILTYLDQKKLDFRPKIAILSSYTETHVSNGLAGIFLLY